MVATAIPAVITGPRSPIAVWICILVSLISVAYSTNHVWATIPLGSKLSPKGNNTWVSPNGTFALGFYPSLDQTDTFSVGIRFNSIPVEAQTVVWTAGENVKVGQNATLELTMDGNLILFDCLNGYSGWTSNTSHRGVIGAVLRDNGNLVLSDSSHKTVWESFDTPTDTLVPGQRLHVDQTLRAASQNSVASYYTLTMESSGKLVLKWESSVSYWESRSESLPSHSVPEGAIFAGNGVFGLFDARGTIVWSRYSNDYTDTKVVLRYLRLDVDGNLRMYSWIEESKSWISGWQAVENQCDVFATCGVYGVCSFNSTGPVCKCPFGGGFDATDLNDPSKGCRRLVDLGACKEGATMLGLKRTVLYGLYPPHDVYVDMGSDKCKEQCLEDDLCVAATAMNDGSGVCRLKRTKFISGFTYSSVAAISFLKICLVPEAVSTQIPPHTTINRPTSINPFESSSIPSGASPRLSKICLIGASLGTLGTFLIIEIGVGWYFCRRRKKGKIPLSGKLALLDPNSRALIRLSYAEVEELTKNFRQKLGPTVFKGVLPNNKTVAVKQLNVEVGEKQFRMTLSVLGSIHHRNLVCLQAFCCECRHRLLIYEYLTNGSLEQWLFGGSMKQAKRLNWRRRLDIATGIARAIAYLHSECRECISHGSLKLENILLDDELAPKVTDFGLGKLTVVSESHGTCNHSTFSSESCPERDIFCFGQMLLEIISGKRDSGCDFPEEDNICTWAYYEYQSGHLENIPDGRMEGNVGWHEVERALRIAFWCMQEQSFLRPSMNEVVKVLEGTIQVDPPPAPFQVSHVDSCRKLHETPQKGDGNKYLELASTSYGNTHSGESSSL